MDNSNCVKLKSKSKQENDCLNKKICPEGKTQHSSAVEGGGAQSPVWNKREFIFPSGGLFPTAHCICPYVAYN